MENNAEHLDDLFTPFDYAQNALETPATEHFPTSDGIAWNDWTPGLEPTASWDNHNGLDPQVDSVGNSTFGFNELLAHQGPNGFEQITGYDFPVGEQLSELTEFDNNETPNDFTNVSLWLNGAYCPPVPCSHCRVNRLQCLIIQTTPANPNPVTSCSSCVALFRECSLARGEKRQPAGFETVTPVLGHLHGVTEQTDEGQPDQIQAPGDHAKDNDGYSRSNTGLNRQNFSRKGAKILRDWYYQHQEYPYPSNEQKAELARETGFTRKQVSDWFTNARRRQKQTMQFSRPVQVFRAGSPMPTSGTESLTPLERWQQSPPEDEPVPESAIQNAIASTSGDMSRSSWNNSHAGDDIFQHSADDVTSASSVGSRNSYASSDSAAWSYHSGESMPFPLISRKSSNRSRKKRTRLQSSQKERRYQCTFCTDTFATKYDWNRHEKSVHLSLVSWICAPKLPETWRINERQAEPTCKFCNTPSPSMSHIEIHEFDVCATRPQSERTFSRKDHLWQHLRKFHHCTKLPNVDVCRTESNNVHSRCGFCGADFQTWSARADHLAEHFKSGARMDQWTGDWGLDPSVLAALKDAMLPGDRAGPG
ncbi:uncharacterized protein ACHE_20863A [Aspergillus chevalieri]|uniref:Homeobox and C2H2 transcription factor n=1 Tax=Aspergillus chevalieri TaxID=182096 RepID=A0A7R7VIM4_ASPCH|nr:uncharacterized protein ACHE_20863A [Aspergillus chevalieri]BCR85405.1 hypothetical protein ACHE_20863A [Aspergillus chevalieri]